MNRISASLGFGALLAMLAAWPAMALDSDRNQPIHIEADSVSIDDQKQISRYQGNVKLTQGSIRATADEITLYADEAGPERMVMRGDPATFRQRPEGKEHDARGSARRIEHDSDAELTVFLGQARFWMDQDKFAGGRIEYDVRNDRVRAEGGADAGDRVRIVIQPKNAGDNGKDDP